MYDETRIPKGRGRLEWKYITGDAPASATTPAAPANPNRARLIVTARFDTPLLGDRVGIWIMENGALVRIEQLSPERSAIHMNRECFGDAIIRDVFIDDVSTAILISVSEVVWHPESKS